MVEDKIVKFCARVGPRSVSLVVNQVGVVKVMWRLNFFSQNNCYYLENSATYLQWKKSYMAYQMAATAVTLKVTHRL